MQENNIKSSDEKSTEIGERTLTVKGITYRFTMNGEYESGILVRKIKTGRDGSIEEETHYLPPILGVVRQKDKLLAMVKTNDDYINFISLADAQKPDSWANAGYLTAMDSMRDPGIKKVWNTIVESIQPTPMSPSVYQGHPPRMIPFIGVKGESSEDSVKEALGLLGKRLKPLGRWVIGFALFSPWARETGCENTLVHLEGEAGSGKTLVAKMVASLFGSSESGSGLFRIFNSSSQGLTSTARDHSYYPMVLDEITTAGALDIETQLINIINGALRTTSQRDGLSSMNDSSWRGLILTTGNRPLPLKAELWARRSLNLTHDDLWDMSQCGTTKVDRENYWSEIYDAIKKIEGWGWYTLTQEYTPGQQNALELTKKIHTYNLTTRGSLGAVGRLAVAGCHWLTEWTGENSWIEGVEAAAVELTDGRVRSGELNPAVKTAQQICESILSSPGRWIDREDSEQMAKSHFSILGYKSTVRGASCKIDHEGGCSYYDCFIDSFEEFADGIGRRVLNDSEFAKTLHSPEKNTISRRIKLKNGEAPRVYSFCLNGLMEITNMTKEDRWVNDKQGGTAVDTMRAINETDSDKLWESVHRAFIDGVKSITVPDTVTVEDFRGEFITSRRTSENARSFTIKRKGGVSKMKVFISAVGITPEETREGLKELRQRGVNYSTPTWMAQKLLRDSQGKGKQPRYQAPDNLLEYCEQTPILHPTQWGLTHRERNTMGGQLTQFDKNRAYLSAMRRAQQAPLWKNEEFTLHKGDRIPQEKVAGFYRIVIPEWAHTSPIPTPLGRVREDLVGEERLITHEIMKLLKTEENRFGSIEVIDCMVAPAHKIGAMEKTVETYETLLNELTTKGARKFVKESYQSFSGTIGSENFSKKTYEKTYRPDWAQAIRDNSYANICRTVYKEMDETGETPLAINVDAIYYGENYQSKTIPLGDRTGQFSEEDSK